MADGQIVLCDACGSGRATVFLTEISNAKVKKSSLCEVCAAKLEATGPGAIAQAIGSGCEYCGAPARGAGSGPGGPIATCAECDEAARDYILAAFGLDPAKTRLRFDDVLLTSLNEMSAEAKAEVGQKMNGLEAYMKQWRQWYSIDA